MKKLGIIILILAIACTGAFASVIQAGVTGRFGGDITNIDDYKVIENYDFGADARLNFSIFGVAANVLFGTSNAGNTVLNTIISANLRADFKVVDLAFGVGYALPVEFADDGVLLAGSPVSEFGDVFQTSQLLARAAVGINIGLIGVSVDYKIPFETLYEYFQGDDLKNLDTFQQGKLAFSVLVNLF